MKYLTSIKIFSSACVLLFYACNNSSAGKTSKSDVQTNSSSPSSTSSDLNLSGGAGSFSYTINGQRVETVNNIQNANLFINEVSNDAANGMLKVAVTTNSSNVFDFQIANSGTTSIKNSASSLSGFMDKKAKSASYMDGKTSRNLYAVIVTVTITSINNSRVSGTFSGTFKADPSDGGETASITDGSFNLPFKKG